MKVLFVSSYKIRCGIASFTDTLETLLEGEVDFDVFALDQFVLRNASPNVNRAGDLAIKKLCDEVIPNFDVVNLQWEPGLLGLSHKQILRRTKMIFGACIRHNKHLVVTAHTVVAVPPKRSFTSRILNIRKNPKDVYRYFSEYFSNYPQATHKLLRWVDRQGKLTLIAHTQRDRRFFKYVVGLRRVVDHPLSYMRKNWLEKLSQENRIVPIRLSQTPTRCRVDPRSGIKLGIGRRRDIARDAEQRAEGVERVETPVEAERELIEVGL
jgi:hypothetical protein